MNYQNDYVMVTKFPLQIIVWCYDLSLITRLHLVRCNGIWRRQLNSSVIKQKLRQKIISRVGILSNSFLTY